LEGRAHSIVQSIHRTVLPLSPHLFRLYRLVSCCRKTDCAAITSSLSSGRLSHIHQLAHSREVSTVPHGFADYNSPVTNTIDDPLLSHTASADA
jgi:hypothetical protein